MRRLTRRATRGPPSAAAQHAGRPGTPGGSAVGDRGRTSAPVFGFHTCVASSAGEMSSFPAWSVIMLPPADATTPKQPAASYRRYAFTIAVPRTLGPARSGHTHRVLSSSHSRLSASPRFPSASPRTMSSNAFGAFLRPHAPLPLRRRYTLLEGPLGVAERTLGSLRAVTRTTCCRAHGRTRTEAVWWRGGRSRRHRQRIPQREEPLKGPSALGAVDR